MPSIPPAQQIVVPVLGMHRSGTSLTTRLLNLLGMELGSPLQPAGPDNPKGFWENRLFQNLNMQMLDMLGFNSDGLGSEKDLYKAFSTLELTDIGTDTLEVLRASLRAQFVGQCWGFKDPRTVLNYPCWERVLAELGYTQVRPVVVLRRPEACAQSLLRRGNLAHIPRPMGQSPSQSALNIWRAYTRILLHHLDLESCLVICQEDLLNPHRVGGELRRMAEWIGTPDVDLSEALAWIEPGLDHREPSEGEQLDPELDSMDQLIRDVAQTQRSRFLQTELPTAPPAMEHPPERCIYIVSPTRYGHSEAFTEIASSGSALRWG